MLAALVSAMVSLTGCQPGRAQEQSEDFAAFLEHSRLDRVSRLAGREPVKLTHELKAHWAPLIAEAFDSIKPTMPPEERALVPEPPRDGSASSSQFEPWVIVLPNGEVISTELGSRFYMVSLLRKDLLRRATAVPPETGAAEELRRLDAMNFFNKSKAVTGHTIPLP